MNHMWQFKLDPLAFTASYHKVRFFSMTPRAVPRTTRIAENGKRATPTGSTRLHCDAIHRDSNVGPSIPTRFHASPLTRDSMRLHIS